MAIKHFLQFKDFTREEFEYVFERTRRIKNQFKSYQQYWPLSDRTLVMIFEKASTRTRLSFEAGMQQLGGSAIYLNTRDSQLGRGEPVEDAAQVISRMSDIVMIRTFEQDIIERFAAQFARAGDQRPDQRIPSVPDPRRHLHLHRASRPHSGQDRGLDRRSNNMCNTWLQAAEVLDFNVHVSTPPGYEVEPERCRAVRHGALRGICRPDGCRSRRRSGDHRRVDHDGLRGRERGAHARPSPTGSVDGDMMRAADAGCAVHALPAGASRRGSDGRGDRRPAIGGLGRGRKPPARTKSVDGISAVWAGSKRTKGNGNERHQESRAGLFRRSRYLGHPEVAAGHLSSARW